MAGPWEKYGGSAAPAPQQPRRQPSRGYTPRYNGPLPESADALFSSLIEQESGGRAGVRGPQTQYGQALGRTQVLPDTAKGIARNLGIPYREDLLTGTTPEAAQYQDALGRAYLEEGFKATGNARDALHYYHGGPNRELWGPKTRQYADEVLARTSRGGGVAPTDQTGPWGKYAATADPESGAITVEQVPDEWANDVVVDQGVVTPSKSEGYNTALEQEKALQALRERSGVGTGFTDQLTAPLNDELAAAAGFITQGLGNIGRRLTGRDIEVTAGERAGAARDVERAAQDEYVKENPGKSLLGGVLGGAAFGPGAGAVPGLLGRFGQAAAIGGAYGVAEGEGAGGRTVNGLLGAGLSAATQGVFEGLPVYARALSRDIERLRAPAGSTPNRGERRVASAIENAVTRDEMTPAGLMAGRSFEGQLPLERGGENLIGLAEVAAQSPGRARTAIIKAVNSRSEGASNRVAGRLAEGFGAEGNVYQNLQQQVAARGDAAKAGMAAIESTPVPLGEDSVRAIRSNLTNKPIRDEIENAIADLSPEGSAAANRLFGLSDQALDNPGALELTVREAQDISYALNEAASRAYRGGFGTRGERLKGLSNAIRGDAREASPEYRQWLQQYGDDSQSIDALRVGTNVFAKANEKNAMSAAQLRDRWADWSDAAKDNYRLGVGEAILDKVRGGQDVATMRKLLKDSELAERARIAFGSDDAFERFMQSAADEVSMQNVNNQLLGGSPTMRRAAGAADVAEQDGGNGRAALDFLTDMTSPVGATRQAVKMAIKSLPKKDRSIIGDQELNGLLGRALTDETEMTRLLNLLEAERALLGRADSRVMGSGLLALPGVSATSQDRSRGLLTANP